MGWNSLCVSAYLEAAKVLELDGARHFALRSLDRVLAEAWQPEQGLQHVLAYSDPAAERRLVPGLLDDYAFTAIACLDAYEATADLSYFNFAQRITDKMVERFFDPVSGGFFDTASRRNRESLGSAGHAPETVSGFSHSRGKFRGRHRVAAAVRFHQPEELSRASGTDAGVAGRAGRQVRDLCRDLRHCSGASLHVPIPRSWSSEKTIWQNSCAPSPPASSRFTRRCSTWPPAKWFRRICRPRWRKPYLSYPSLKEGKSVAVVCSGFSCQPPVMDPEQLRRSLGIALKN